LRLVRVEFSQALLAQHPRQPRVHPRRQRRVLRLDRLGRVPVDDPVPVARRALPDVEELFQVHACTVPAGPAASCPHAKGCAIRTPRRVYHRSNRYWAAGGAMELSALRNEAAWFVDAHRLLAATNSRRLIPALGARRESPAPLDRA